VRAAEEGLQLLERKMVHAFDAHAREPAVRQEASLR
jgi:hypothetical protein